jgi:hypothetical protein
VFKTRIKRFEFGTTIVMLAFMAVVAGIMLISAYGWTCVATDPSVWAEYRGGKFTPGPPIPPYDYGYIGYEWYGTFGTLIQVLYFITWGITAAWAVVIYAFLTNRKWAYWAALGTAAVGFVVGIIPALMADTNGFTFSVMQQIPYADPPLPGNWVETYEGFSIGSPHWAKALSSLLILIVILPYPRSPVTKSLKSFSSPENKWAPGIARQLMMMSVFFIMLGFFSFLGSEFMRDAHVIVGVNVWQIVQIQFTGGIVTTAIGSSMLVGGFVIHKFKKSSTLTKPL